jgi:tetratricopeptide (TPR) repeat protein
MRRAWLPWFAAIVAATLLALPGPASAAGSSKDARRIYEEATAAFGLGRYADAAEKYEAAFSLRPDPALLYNAAQSYRLAGNKQRALELYRNYVRLYPDGTNAEDARTHVAALKKAIEDERSPIAPRAVTAPPPPAATPAPAPARVGPAPASPPVAVLPPPAMPPPVETAPPPSAAPPAADANVPMVSQLAQPADEQKPLTRQTWFWVAVGVAAAVVGTTVILFATRGETYPNPTFGSARGN